MHSLLAVVLAVAVVGVSLAQESAEWAQFRQFMADYQRPYANLSTEVLSRFAVFRESLARQERLNSEGGARYGVNKFSDLTPREFRERHLSGMMRGDGLPDSSSVLQPRAKADVPSKFDWRDKGAVNAIRNQERCGSCWAFAVVETIASRFAVQQKRLVTLSPQQLISCEHNPSLDGCSGGVLQVAFHVLNGSAPVVLESDYPFASGDGVVPPCKTSLPNRGLQLLNFIYHDGMRNETEMQEMLFTFSPLTTSINALSWQDYIGGIIQHHCTSTTIDHAVQVVGYDLTGPVPYWIVRNTWGKDWGENGYIRIKFGENMCGIADEVASVTNVKAVNL